MHDLQAQERTSLRLPFWLQFLMVSGASVGLGWLLSRGVAALPSFSLLLHTLLRQIPQWLWELLFALALVLVGVSLKEAHKEAHEGQREQQRQEQRQRPKQQQPDGFSPVTRLPSASSQRAAVLPFLEKGDHERSEQPGQRPYPPSPQPPVSLTGTQVRPVHPDPVTPLPEVFSDEGDEGIEQAPLPAQLTFSSSVPSEVSDPCLPAPMLTLVPTTLPSLPSLPTPSTPSTPSPGSSLTPVVYEEAQLQSQQGTPSSTEAYLAITLLGQVSVTLCLPDGSRHPLAITPMHAQLLAYLAVLRGKRIHRRDIVYALCEWRSEDGTGDDTTFAKLFYGRVKGMRRKLKEEIAKVNDEAGTCLLDPATLDPLSSSDEEWGITSCCRVVDLEQIEDLFAHIEQARKEGNLTAAIPPTIKTLCEHVLACYQGDFIADLIKKEPENFKPWERRASWAKQYVTKYRSYRFTALWLLGTYEEQQAERCRRLLDTLLAGEVGEEFHTELEAVLSPLTLQQSGRQAGILRGLSREQLTEALRSCQRLLWGKALDAYRSYALTACTTPYYPGLPFDELVSYHAASGGFGDRIVASEQALRRALKACAFLGDTREAARIYCAYEDVMTSLFKAWGLKWSPSEETLKEWHTASSLTDAHRFSLPPSSS